MGLFDEIRCKAPLPDGREGGDVWFQTNSFPFPLMRRYTITADGRLIDSAGNDLEPDGYITFYKTEDEGAGTRWREYRARFSEGRLQQIVRVTSDDDRRHYGLASFRWFDARSSMFDEPDDDK